MLAGSVTSADSRLSTKLASTNHPPRPFVVGLSDVPAEGRSMCGGRFVCTAHTYTRAADALALLVATLSHQGRNPVPGRHPKSRDIDPVPWGCDGRSVRTGSDRACRKDYWLNSS